MQTVTAPAVSARMDASPRTRDLRALVELAKPGITLMEVVTAAVGYWVSQPWLRMELWEVLLRLSLLSVGVLFLGASAGTFNHLLERTTDAMMQRTSFRPLPEGRISVAVARIFAWFLFGIGICTLLPLGWTVTILGAVTVLLYTIVYTPLKTKTALALYLGGIPGALPVIGGWVAGGGSLLSIEAAILGAIMYWWQLPHFLALAIMFAEDYRRGGIILLAGGNAKRIAIHTLIHAVLLIVSSAAWWAWGRGGVLYALGWGIFSVWLLVQCLQLVRQPDTNSGRRVLIATYMFLMGLFLFMAVDVG